MRDPENNPAADELDLRPYIESAGKKVEQIKGGVGRFILFLKSHLRMLGIFLFAGMLFGVLHYILRPETYRSSLLAYTNYLNNEYAAYLIRMLDDLVDEQNTAELATRLKISEAAAAAMVSIEYSDFNEKYEELYQDTIVSGIPFSVELEVRNPDVYGELQEGIHYYFEHIPYVERRLNLSRQRMEGLMSRLNSEQQAIDSLKKIVDQSIIPRGNASGIILGEPINPVAVYREGVDLFQRELEIREDLQLLTNLEIIEGFTPFREPYRPRLVRSVFFGIVAGLGCGLLFLLLIRKRTN